MPVGGTTPTGGGLPAGAAVPLPAGSAVVGASTRMLPAPPAVSLLYHYKYSHRFPPRRACNRNLSSWKGVLPYRCLQMGKVVKVGPWGANEGNAFDTGRVDRFTKVKIYHGDVIYGLEITFVVGGKTQPPMLIGSKKRASQKITLDEDEHFTSISGYFKPMLGNDIFITQLTLTTDENRNVSAGKETGNPFSLALEEGGHIVGFCGLLGQPTVAVEAIAVHCSLADS
ncbi:hypothetical protein C4D60_Mb10t19910 [Musa balbisiana]|uniref:Jacalin-type lectin domain-containing protein n=1 Tax=Musa balbisiana TaxID=52838 RepID=A0A4S8IYC4_MUSBA|nr:hypothetical protein C4D60_Mb10t19910 [Musa balbisiana]